MTERKVYEKVLTNLDVHGWTRRNFGAGDGPKCIEGHVNYVIYGRTNPQVISGKHFVLRAQIMNRLTRLCGCRPMSYNDSYGIQIDHIRHLIQLALDEVTPPPCEQRRRWWHRDPKLVAERTGHEFYLKE